MYLRLVAALLVLSFGIGLSSNAAAQQRTKTPRVGVLHAGNAIEAASVQREPFERGLRELGWTPGSNVYIEYRYGEGSVAKLVEAANEMAHSGVDVIVARGDSAINAAREAT